MKRLCVIMPLVLCFMISCQDKQSKAELDQLKVQAELEKRNKEIVKKWLGEYDKGNLSIIYELIAEECKVYYGEDTYGREWLEASCEAMTRSFSDGVHIIDDLIAEKNKVVARLTVQVVHTGEFMGTSSTGKKVKYHAFTVYHVEEGKIRELWMDHNATLELMVKLGVEL